MNLKWVMVLACVFVLSCTEQTQSIKTAPQVTLMSLIQTYDEQLSKVQLAINSGRSKEVILLYSNELYATAQTILALFSEQQSKCTDYFSKLFPVSEQFKTSASQMRLSNESIQSALPQFNEPICYHLKELLVQPVFISSLTAKQGPKDGNKQSKPIEMLALEAHVAQVKHVLIGTAHL
ncbi:hypothetical protein HG263_19765 [Pseudoalteromonas sp. JBTF-M23]|uniref:Lipoprotein n=1 Tax=Pseudoalteromonas caenipelagi TaxID=2726988 RepID=A0A849VJC0_9GAMM|nr:hypothetical protein [Pseudoalteromonas caenipelagi]NOU52748.1 hypothetical protein [Pseudoalteromonas caenipelagi]